MSLPALYDLSAQYRALLALDDEEVPQQVVVDTLEALAGDIQDKAVNVAKVVRSLDAFADDIEEAAKQMRDRAAKFRRRADGLRSYLLHNMLACEISKIESPYFTLTVKKNPASVVVFDPNQIPADFMRQKPAPPPEPDKTAIKQALQSGTDVPGCKLEQGVRLEVKA